MTVISPGSSSRQLGLLSASVAQASRSISRHPATSRPARSNPRSSPPAPVKSETSSNLSRDALAHGRTRRDVWAVDVAHRWTQSTSAVETEHTPIVDGTGELVRTATGRSCRGSDTTSVWSHLRPGTHRCLDLHAPEARAVPRPRPEAGQSGREFVQLRNRLRTLDHARQALPGEQEAGRSARRVQALRKQRLKPTRQLCVARDLSLISSCREPPFEVACRRVLPGESAWGRG